MYFHSGTTLYAEFHVCLLVLNKLLTLVSKIYSLWNLCPLDMVTSRESVVSLFIVYFSWIEAVRMFISWKKELLISLESFPILIIMVLYEPPSFTQANSALMVFTLLTHSTSILNQHLKCWSRFFPCFYPHELFTWQFPVSLQQFRLHWAVRDTWVSPSFSLHF